MAAHISSLELACSDNCDKHTHAPADAAPGSGAASSSANTTAPSSLQTSAVEPSSHAVPSSTTAVQEHAADNSSNSSSGASLSLSDILGPNIWAGVSPTAVDVVNDAFEAVKSAAKFGPISLTQSSFYCQICLLQNPLSEAYQLGCGHLFCRQCLALYLQNRVSDGETEFACCYMIDQEKPLSFENDTGAQADTTHTHTAGSTDSTPVLLPAPVDFEQGGSGDIETGRHDPSETRETHGGALEPYTPRSTTARASAPVSASAFAHAVAETETRRQQTPRQPTSPRSDSPMAPYTPTPAARAHVIGAATQAPALPLPPKSGRRNSGGASVSSRGGGSGGGSTRSGGASRRNSGVCGYTLTETEISELLDSAHMKKYYRFRTHSMDRRARDCPKCEHTQIYEQGEKEKVCVCGACGHSYCYLHSDAHAGSTCAEYEKRTKHTDRAARALIKRTCRKCPGRGCGFPVEKAGGCNHMKCTKCKTCFCWICGQSVGDGQFPYHYAWWNFMGCPTRQMSEDDKQWGRWEEMYMRLGFFLLVLFISPLALMMTVLLLPFILIGIHTVCRLPCLRETWEQVGKLPFVHLVIGVFTFWGYVWICMFAPFAFCFYQLGLFLYYCGKFVCLFFYAFFGISYNLLRHVCAPCLRPFTKNRQNDAVTRTHTAKRADESDSSSGGSDSAPSPPQETATPGQTGNPPSTNAHTSTTPAPQNNTTHTHTASTGTTPLFLDLSRAAVSATTPTAGGGGGSVRSSGAPPASILKPITHPILVREEALSPILLPASPSHVRRTAVPLGRSLSLPLDAETAINSTGDIETGRPCLLPGLLPIPNRRIYVEASAPETSPAQSEPRGVCALPSPPAASPQSSSKPRLKKRVTFSAEVDMQLAERSIHSGGFSGRRLSRAHTSPSTYTSTTPLPVLPPHLPVASLARLQPTTGSRPGGVGGGRPRLGQYNPQPVSQPTECSKPDAAPSSDAGRTPRSGGDGGVSPQGSPSGFSLTATAMFMSAASAFSGLGSNVVFGRSLTLPL